MTIRSIKLSTWTPPQECLWDAIALQQSQHWKIPLPLEFLEQARKTPLPEEISRQKAYLETCQAADFNLTEIIEWAAPLRDNLYNRQGVVLLQVRELDDSAEDCAALKLLFLWIGFALGEVNIRYGRLYNVVDTGQSYTRERIPVSQTCQETHFHTDSSAKSYVPDVIGLLCLKPAQQGGDSQIVSALRIHAELIEKFPELLEELYCPFFRDVVTPGITYSLSAIQENQFAIFSEFERYPQHSELQFRYMRYWIETAYQKLDARLTKRQNEAFDLLDYQLRNPRFCHTFRMESGDMLFLNNRRHAHNRTAFKDPESSPKSQHRQFIRIWLNEKRNSSNSLIEP